MSLALYRRYRPETFEEVIGQEHVTGPLQQALRNQRINHAYLFSGPRGCGKTTSARILARCLNCEQGPTPTPCGTCRSCVGLARGAAGSIDVIEIDAASHGGVDDARDLRERAFFAPVESRYKIYILDEAHMVSSAGFNALLKVVEEPPPHLKFIFATTEPEKVIGTIRSRTHHYPFRLVPPGTLREYLAKLCDQEGIKVEPEVLPLVVRAGAGSVRDSLSVLDQLLAGADENGVSYTNAAALLGYTDAALLDEAVGALAAQSGAAAFEIVDRVAEGGHDPRRFLGDLLERLRDLVILNAVPDAATKGLITAPPDRMTRMLEQAASFGQAELSRAADLASTGLTEMRGATAPRLLLELVFARILLPGGEEAARSLAARLERLERFGPPAGNVGGGGGAQVAADVAGAGNGVAPGGLPAPEGSQNPQPAQHQSPQQSPQQNPQQSPQQQDPAAGSQYAGAGSGASSSALATPPWRTASSAAGPSAPVPAAAEPTAPPAHAAAPASSALEASAGDVASIRTRWPEILDRVRSQSKVTWAMVSADNAHVVGVEGRTVQLGFNIPTLRENFPGSKHEDLLRQVLGQTFGGDWRIEVIVDPSAGHGGASSPHQPSYPSGSGGGGDRSGGSGVGVGSWPGTAAPGSAPGSVSVPAPAPAPTASPSAPQQQQQPPTSTPQNAMSSAMSSVASASTDSIPSAYPAVSAQPTTSGGFGPMPNAAAPAPVPAYAAAAASAPSVGAAVALGAPAGYAAEPAHMPPPPFVTTPPAQAPAGPPPFVPTGYATSASAATAPDFAAAGDEGEEAFDPHLAALHDEAVPADPGPSARELLIKELGATILDEGQNPD